MQVYWLGAWRAACGLWEFGFAGYLVFRFRVGGYGGGCTGPR